MSWRAIKVALCEKFGYTPDEAGEITLPDIRDLFAGAQAVYRREENAHKRRTISPEFLEQYVGWKKAGLIE